MASAPLYVFPSELRDSTQQYPYMCFSIPTEAAAADVYIPVPPGLTFSDSMVYSTISLGIIGNIAKETINQAKTGQGLVGTLTAGVGGLASSTLDKAKKLNVAAAASIGLVSLSAVRLCRGGTATRELCEGAGAAADNQPRSRLALLLGASLEHLQAAYGAHGAALIDLCTGSTVRVDLVCGVWVRSQMLPFGDFGGLGVCGRCTSAI